MYKYILVLQVINNVCYNIRDTFFILLSKNYFVKTSLIRQLGGTFKYSTTYRQ